MGKTNPKHGRAQIWRPFSVISPLQNTLRAPTVEGGDPSPRDGRGILPAKATVHSHRSARTFYPLVPPRDRDPFNLRLKYSDVAAKKRGEKTSPNPSQSPHLYPAPKQRVTRGLCAGVRHKSLRPPVYFGL